MGLLDGLFGSGGDGDRDRALEAVQNVPLPILKEYYPELYQQVVQLNPEIESAVTLGPSEMAGVATDPSLRQAQMKALGKLTEIGEAGGRDAQFLADQARLESDINTQVAGQQGAIQQNLATRGLSGGMSEVVQRNIASQQGANRMAQMGMDAKAQAERRALEALMQSGQLAGQMEGQDFNQKSAKAQAADSIARFNASNLQGVNQRNTATKNAAQEYNATGAQNTANNNTNTRNDAQKYNLGIAQQNFDNQMARATGVAKQYGDKADAADRERDGEREFVGGLIGAGASFYGKK